jgi:hypothetical protein
MDRTLETTAPVPSGAPAHRERACLVAGCPCKDARIVSMRRASFFGCLAQARGETADRSVAPDAEWILPKPVAFDPAFARIG